MWNSMVGRPLSSLAPSDAYYTIMSVPSTVIAYPCRWNQSPRNVNLCRPQVSSNNSNRRGKYWSSFISMKHSMLKGQGEQNV